MLESFPELRPSAAECMRHLLCKSLAGDSPSDEYNTVAIDVSSAIIEAGVSADVEELCE
jgi:hypothetical protein